MAIKVYPVASTNVKYYTTDHISMNNNLIKEKTIFNNGFIVSALTTPDLSVNVSSGECRIQGKYLSSSTTTNVLILANTDSYNRYDLIVVDVSGEGSIKVIKGTPSSNPTIPSASNNQIILAQVLVGSGVSSIQSSNITDLRSTNNQYFMESLDKSIHDLETKTTIIENKLAIKREFTGSGAVKKIIIEDNKDSRIKRQYLKCSLTATEWKTAWQNLTAGTNNNNGGLWVGFYDSVNVNNVIDASLNISNINKWMWLNKGSSKLGIAAIGGINSSGCYVFLENKFPEETTLGIDFTVCITEKY